MDLPYKNKGDLTTGPVEKHLIRLTVPMIWGLMAVILVQITDTYFVALLGTHELAGISFTFPVTMMITHMLFGINIALSSVIARLIGEKRMDDVRRVTTHGILIACGASILIAIFCYALLDPLFQSMGADETLMKVIRDYMPFWLLGSVFLSIPTNGNSAIRAAGDTLSPALVMTSMAVINFILDPILIFGLLGAPAMGVKGAAIATMIAYIAGMVFGLYILIVKKDMLSRSGLHLELLGDSFRRIIFIAIPAGITNIIMPLTNTVIVALLAGYGATAVAAFGIATRVEALAMLLVISLALGMAPIVGQNWGAKNFPRVHRAINLSIGFNFVWSFLVAAILALLAYPLARAFSTDETVIHYTVLFFWIVPFSYAFGNLVFGWSSAFNAMGLPQYAFVMIVAKSLVLTVPAVCIGGWLAGPVGIFIAIALVNLGAGIGFHLLSWKKCLQQEHTLQPAA